MATAPPDERQLTAEPYALLRLLARPRAVVRRRLEPAWRRRIAIFVGGAVGTGLRSAVSLVPASETGWPWGTFLVNMTGAFLLAYLVTRFLEVAPHTALTVPLIGQGVIGSYTTFSAVSVEVWRLLDAGRSALALTYGLISVVVGFALALAGIRAARSRP